MHKTIFALSVLLLMASGFSIELAGHKVIVTVNNDGSADVIETYTLQLAYEEYLEFERIATSTSTDLQSWQTFFSDIDNTILGNVTSLTTSASTAGAGNFGNGVILDYSVSNFASREDKIGRDIIYEIDGPSFSFYNLTINKFILPWKTELQIKFAPAIKKTNILEVTPEPVQSAMVDGQYTLFWYGMRIDNTFNVKYKMEENVGEFDIGTMLNSAYLFFSENPTYALAVLVILVLVIVYRKPIIELISESFGGEEEIEQPKRGV